MFASHRGRIPSLHSLLGVLQAWNNSQVDYGIDENGAHVKPSGLYHYHTVPTQEITGPDPAQDIVHVGFALDGYFMYHSRSGVYKSSYVLKTESRGYTCNFTEPTTQEVTLFEETPDGNLVPDWVYTYGAIEPRC